MTIKLAFGYKARSGKDTAGEYLVNKNNNSRIMRFSSTLYEISKDIYKRAGIPWKKDRLLLQWIGTEWGRSIDPNIWVNALLKDIVALEGVANVICVTDMRFQNEAIALKKNGFTLVNVVRSKENRGIVENENHPSEIDLDGFDQWDYVIENNGTLEEFYAKVDAIKWSLS